MTKADRIRSENFNFGEISKKEIIEEIGELDKKSSEILKKIKELV